MTFLRRSAVVVVCSLVATACAIGETRYETAIEPLQKASDSVSCTGNFAKPDLAALEPCGDGKGHCYDAAHTPSADKLVACPDATKVCVPDEILEAGGGKLKSCTSIIGPGGCVTATLIPEIIKQGGSALKPDVCAATQLCVPCIDPTHGNAPTPFCQAIGVNEGTCSHGAGTRAPSCCHSAGICMTRDGVPEDSRDDLSRDTCPVNNLCAPAAMVSGDPRKCSLFGLSGVCLDVCFAKMLSTTTQVTRSGCGPTELCMPCLIGKGQGMPGCSE